MSHPPRHRTHEVTTPSNGTERRILHLAAPDNYGGLERVIHSLAVSQRDCGRDVSVALFVETGTPLPGLVEELRDERVPVHLIATPARSYVGQWRALRRLLAVQRPDVVHSHGYVADVMTRLARPAGRALVATVHGFTGGDRKNRAYEWMQCRAYRSFDAVVAVSRPLAEVLAERGVRRAIIDVVPNGHGARVEFLSVTAAREKLAIPPDVFSVGWVGRLSREKGLDVLIEGLVTVRDLPIRLTIIGSGPERDGLERRIADLGVASSVTWAGPMSQARRLMPAFDLLVNSSRTEGTPITLLEAMAAHVPIVATTVGGVPDLLTDEDAILVSSERPDAIAAAVRSVHADRGAARVRATNARRRLDETFAVGPWLDAYERVYTRAQAAAARGRA